MIILEIKGREADREEEERMCIRKALAMVLISTILTGQTVYAQDAEDLSDMGDASVTEEIGGTEQIETEDLEEETDQRDEGVADSPEAAEESYENDPAETKEVIDSQDLFSDISQEAEKIWMSGNTGTANVPQVYAANVILNGFNGDTSTGWYSTFKSLRDPEYYELTEYLMEDGVLCWTSNFWNAAFNSEFRDNPSYFYEVVLMGFLKHEQNQMSMDGAWNSKEMSLSLSIYNELVGQYTDTYEEGALEELVKSIGKMPAEEASQKISTLTNVSLGADALNTLKQGCSTAKDLIDAISEYQTLLDAKQERITLLKLAKEKITDNDYFAKAVDDIIAKMEAAPIEYLAGETLEKLWDEFMDSAWDLIVKGSPMEPILKAIDIEKMMLDVLFNSSDTASNNFKLLVVYIVDTYFKSALELSKANYEGAGTIPNAASFVECYQAYIDYQIYGLEYTKTFIKDIVDSGPLHNLIEQIFFRESIESAEELAGVCDGQISSRKSCLSLLGRLPGIYSNANGMTQLEDVLSKVDASGKVAVESISFSKSEVVLEHMDDIFVAYADVYPANASNKKIRYTSSNPAVLEVPENGGFATLKSPGTVTVTAVSEDGGYKASQMITVKEGNRMTEVEKGRCGENLNWVFYSDGTLYIYGTGVMINWYYNDLPPWKDYLKKITCVIISKGVSFIGSSAFHECSSLKSIRIPEGVTSIGSGAFDGCSSLKSITIPEGVTSIGDYAFYGCSSLKSITIPEGVTSIRLSTFGGCSSLGNITIPEGVTSIEDCAFDGCSSLKSITIPKGVTSIEGGAFRGCSSLKSITIPEGVTSIRLSTFSGCSSLGNITIPEGVTSIGISAFYGCSSLKNITIPKGVTSIGDYAFYGCSSLKSITIPEGVTSIGDHAFDGCSGLESIVIPEGVTIIGYGVFYGCSSLESITIPKGVTDIGDGAFSGCSGLESIVIPEGVVIIGDRAFEGCSSLKSITIPEKVTSIGDSTFYRCSSLESIEIPKGVTSISSWAIYECRSLQKIIMHGDAPSADGYTFGMVDNMVIYVPKNAKGYDAYPWNEYKIVYGDNSEDYKKGDVNEDGTVDIKDLQIILRSVCEKIKLTDRQKTIADITKDGKVDIHDLRKELRFVCGKIEAL